MAGNMKDFATGTVATAPSPATSGTSLVLQTGEGSRMPATPFYSVAHPTNEFPTLDNAEKIQVTGVSGNTLTIVRAQGDTTAKSIATGWRISNSLFLNDLNNGWCFTTAQPSYTSADAPSYVVTFASGIANSLVSIGMKVKLTDASTTKYFIITGTATGGGGELIVNLYGGTDYTLSGGAITNFAFSDKKVPFGFPMSPTKWSVRIDATAAVSLNSPTTNQWYNVLSLSVPIGSWNLSYSGVFSTTASGTSPNRCYVGCGTTSAATGDSDMECFVGMNTGLTAAIVLTPARSSKNILLTSKTSYYLNMMTTQAATYLLCVYSGAGNPYTIANMVAVCNYL